MVFVFGLILAFALTFLGTKLLRKVSPSVNQGYVIMEFSEHAENLNKSLPKLIQKGLELEKVYITKLKLGCLLRAEPSVFDSIDKNVVENMVRQEEGNLRLIDFISKLKVFQLIITVRNQANSEPKEFVFSKEDFA